MISGAHGNASLGFVIMRQRSQMAKYIGSSWAHDGEKVASLKHQSRSSSGCMRTNWTVADRLEQFFLRFDRCRCHRLERRGKCEPKWAAVEIGSQDTRLDWPIGPQRCWTAAENDLEYPQVISSVAMDNPPFRVDYPVNTSLFVVFFFHRRVWLPLSPRDTEHPVINRS